MKIAVLSDVHGNVPALEAVFDDLDQWRPDQVIFNGDVVNRGPYSLRCLQLIHKQYPSAQLLKGNHENFVLSCAESLQNPDVPEYDLYRFTYWTAKTLGQTVEDIKQWPDHLDLTELDDGSTFHITHGSRLGNRSGIEPGTPDEELAAKLGTPCDLFIASHTHKPLVRRFNGRHSWSIPVLLDNLSMEIHALLMAGSATEMVDGVPRLHALITISKPLCEILPKADFSKKGGHLPG
jgi:predicted phosphodiesterase